jgi:hypothetical protein
MFARRSPHSESRNRRPRLRHPSATIKQPKKASDTADPNAPPRLDAGKGRGEPNLAAEVAGADDVLDLPRHEHGLELGGQVGRPMRDVQIPERQHQHHPSPSPQVTLFRALPAFTCSVIGPRPLGPFREQDRLLLLIPRCNDGRMQVVRLGTGSASRWADLCSSTTGPDYLIHMCPVYALAREPDAPARSTIP